MLNEEMKHHRISVCARELMACKMGDPARKHADHSPAKGRWTTITAPTELVERLRTALSAPVVDAKELP